MLRKLGKFALIGIGVLVLSCGALVLFALWYEGNAEPEYVNEDVEFEHALKIPPLLDFTEEDGKKVFHLTLQEGDTEFFEGVQTETMGANGSYLMPTIRATKGDDVEIRVTSELNERTTIHWHGMHLPAAMDGVHQIIEPDETWTPYWEIRQQAATLWYHPHLMGKTGPHVYEGLAGLFILDDENSASLNLPDEYGVDDIPLIIQDREFDDDGQFVYDANQTDFYGHTGMLGDTILVNGTYAPYVEVPGKMIRLRIVNGSNARRYNFGFSDGREFYQIASDGGFLERPLSRTRMMLAVGERAEILVDMSDLETVTLMSYAIPTDKDRITRFFERVTGTQRDEEEIYKILELRPQPTIDSNFVMPERLNTIERWDENEAVQTRTFRLGPNTINGKKMALDRIDEVALVGTKEIWEITNRMPFHHPFHVHDVQFLVLERNGEPPPAYEQGWKDTVIVNSDETVRIMIEFKDYANPHVAYMFHCHILEHEDHGMMGQFVVVEDLSVEPEIQTEALDKRVGHNH
ncbi:MAG: multicopper oxidase domain-containing protein [Chloroflexi bacterium]|nr:multicopper oxidase domain-containing protein [Chloroflexota bacterium]